MNDMVGKIIKPGQVVLYIQAGFNGAYHMVGVVERMTPKRVRVLAAPLIPKKDEWTPKFSSKTPGKLLVVQGLDDHHVVKTLRKELDA